MSDTLEIKKQLTFKESFNNSYKVANKLLLSNPVRKSYTIIVVTLFVLIFVVLFILRPTLNSIDERKGQVNTLEDDLKFMNDRYNLMSNLSDEYFNIEYDLGKISAFYPYDHDYVWFTDFLLSEMGQSNITFKAINYNFEDRDLASYSPLSMSEVSFMCTGTNISDFFSYIDKIKSSQNKPYITNTSIIRNEDGTYMLTIKMKIWSSSANLNLPSYER